jgi:hypothetical protein
MLRRVFSLFMPLVSVFGAALITHSALLHPPTEWSIARIQLHSTTALSRQLNHKTSWCHLCIHKKSGPCCNYSRNRISGQPVFVRFLVHESLSTCMISALCQYRSSTSTAHFYQKIVNGLKKLHIIQLLLRAEYISSNLRSNAST